MQRYQSILCWAGLLLLVVVPITASLMSPLLAWRQPVYIIAGLSGVVALALLLFQPMLAVGHLPGLNRLRSRRIHRVVGISLILLVVIHVVGLWFTSPPDVVDALLFRSPTPFSAWGVIAMWALLVSGVMVALRSKVRLRLFIWRWVHLILAGVVVAGSVAHAMLVEGTMEVISKSILCLAVVVAMLWVLRAVVTKR